MKAQTPVFQISIFFAIFVFVTTLPLKAENRFYEIKEPIGEVITSLVDALSQSGHGFRVEKVYNPKQDGHEGMMLRFTQSGALCEFLFLPHPIHKNQSKIRVFAQDKRDAEWLHELLTKKLRMKLSGVSGKVSKNTWPVRVRPRR